MLCRRLALLVLIVQDRGVRIERHDVGVGQLSLAVSRGAHVRHVNLVLRLARAERGFGRNVPARREVRGVAHAFELVFGLDRARIVQPVEQRFRVALRETPLRELLLPFTDECAAPQVREMAARFAGLANDFDLEVMRPEAVRQRGRLVPVVGRLQEDQPRLLARPIHQPAIDRVFERHPQLEMRIRLERIRMIVEEQHVRAARVDRQRVELAERHRFVGALTLDADVFVEE